MASSSSRIERPIFIVAAPRSGSTLLFETLAHAEALWTVGGESHLLIEGIPKLSVGPAGVASNRLTAMDADPLTAQQIRVRFLERLVDRDGSLRKPNQAGPFRLLEKTPKNSLRIPFFHSIYPDARFVFLHRDPRENLSSIMEAWRAGGWTTYKALPEWDGPWSLLLPPGYAALRGKPLAEVAAFQWAAANRHVLDDLAELPRDRWIAVGYADFIADPATEVRRICAFIDVPVDAYLERIALTGKLPLSRYTLTPPAPDKWRRNAEAIATAIGAVDLLYERLLRTVLPAGVAQQKLDAFRRVPAQINRNEACYCGSTRRYKHCHGALV